MYARSDIRQLIGHHADGATQSGHPLGDQSHPFFPATDALTRIAVNNGMDVRSLTDHFDALYDPSHPLANHPATQALAGAFPGIDKLPIQPPITSPMQTPPQFSPSGSPITSPMGNPIASPGTGPITSPLGNALSNALGNQNKSMPMMPNANNSGVMGANMNGIRSALSMSGKGAM